MFNSNEALAHMRRRVTVVVCVCVYVWFDFSNSNESAKKTYGSPQRCNHLIYNMGFSFHT